jgi:hypothetical protein
VKRDEIYAVIDGERQYAVSRWSPEAYGPELPVGVFVGESGPEAAHEVESFILYMQDYLDEARRLASRSVDLRPALGVVRKAVALGVACFEQHGVPPRAV